MKPSLQPVRMHLRRLWSGVTGYAAYAALEGAVLGVFDGFTEQQLLEAIETDCDVWAVPWGDFEEFRGQVRLLSQDPRFQKHGHLLTVENVLLWLTGKDGRPLLASVIINTPGGVQWLSRQLEGFKTGVMEPLEEVEEVG